jgi:isochorismate synthase
MSQDHFFTTIIEHYNNKLPFVVYRKPNTNPVKGLLQKDNNIYKTEHFTESGFVFAPFNTENESILIPLEHSEVIETKYASDELYNNISESVKGNKNTSEATKDFHVNLVDKAVKAIDEEVVFKKVVISRKEVVKISEDNPIKLFKKLLDSYKTAFVYCWYHPNIGLWLGATPETLLKVQGNQLSTMALAGTQKYKGTMDVIWLDKERTEQQLVTDFIVDQVKPLVSSLSIGKTETLKAGSLLHLKTELRGLLEKGNNNLKNIVLALHPTPAVCGMPKAKAKQFILDNENYNREFYTGFLGELNIKEHITRNNNRRNVENNAYNTLKTVTTLYVNLRCMQYKNAEIILYVGGGITKDSIPEKEWEETVNKTLTVKSIL